MGQVPGQVVAATFGVFYPPLVVALVSQAWAVTTAEEVQAARVRGTIAGLERILGPSPEGAERATAIMQRAADAAPVEGRPLFAGLSSQPWPGSVVGNLWHAADLLREHRGDAHVGAWANRGLRPLEVMLLSEAWWGVPLGSALRNRMWPQEELDATIASLRERGWLDGESLTDAGADVREAVEAATDEAERSVLESIGDDLDELVSLVEPWSTAVVEAGAFPRTVGSLKPTLRMAQR
jgi:hypothetical protein